jgi:tetratricopeptide (TPR) repeat protein
VATPAPVLPDYLYRDHLVGLYEGNARHNPDQITTRMLASQYLMRYRESGDVTDLLRAEHVAQESLALQPRFNMAGEMTMASAQLALHRFHDALTHARNAMQIEQWNTAAIAQAAGIETELGNYGEADRLLRSARPGPTTDIGLYTARSRYDEITGNVAEARRLIDRAMVYMDSVIDNPAEARAWYHFRAGELAWSAGDVDSAELRFREALDIFPNYARAYNGLARLYWGQRRWKETLEAATRAADLVPLPETLGYKADAQRALGDEHGARVTQDLIVAIERIGNARGLNDRALAVYYSEHSMRLADAVAIARRDVALRDDVFAEDTLAWALAQFGRWQAAAAAERKAVRFDTEDARLQYHAGIIALHQGNDVEAKKRLLRALDLNAQFHPYYADDARRLLSNT